MSLDTFPYDPAMTSFTRAEFHLMLYGALLPLTLDLMSVSMPSRVWL
jgi:hypothetical protein